MNCDETYQYRWYQKKPYTVMNMGVYSLNSLVQYRNSPHHPKPKLAKNRYTKKNQVTEKQTNIFFLKFFSYTVLPIRNQTCHF